MKKFSFVLVVVMSLLLIALPVMAKGGGGNGGGNSSVSSGNGNGSSKGAVDQSSANSSKSDKGSSSGIDKSKNTNGPSQKGQTGKSSENKVLKNKSEKQVDVIKDNLQQKRSEVAKKKFTDTSKHWSSSNIEKVQKLGLMSGYTDGSFKPDAPITSVEAMVIAVNMAELVSPEETTGETTTTETNSDSTTTTGTTGTTTEEGTTDTTVGEDVPEWAQDEAQEATKLQIVNMNRFHSSVQASRAQTAVMLAKALGLEPVDSAEYTFSDSVLISSEDLGYIIALREAGIVFGRPDGKFNPNSKITRAEVASMLAKAVENIEDEEDDGTTTDSGDSTTGDNTGTTGDNSTCTTTDTGTNTTTDTGTGTDTGTQTGTSTDSTTATTNP
ncbi:MAG: S-layer homology domain-containing protein [Deltaproteobacteria bacterium]